MTRRRLLALAVLVTLTLTAGTGGFSATTADRGVTVSVADDDAAVLGIERDVSGTANGTTTLTVTLTSRFDRATLTSAIVRVDGTATDIAADRPLTPGAAGAATFPSVDCDATVRVTASGDQVGVSLNRAVPCG
jgi:hypothetical protein